MRSFPLPFAVILAVAACESGGSSGRKGDATSSGDTATSGADSTDGADGTAAGDGSSDGASDGASDGSTDGSADGASDGATDGSSDGGACLDAAYTETLPDRDASLAAELSAYDPEDPQTFILAALAKRYPTGKYLVEGGLKDTSLNCIEQFLGNRDTGGEVLTQLSTIVHECGHVHDLRLGSFETAVYAIRSDLVLECPGGAYTGPNSTFARSLINGDSFASARPSCGGSMASGCDFYADTYLTGSPDNAAFEGGDQGFDSVLEEATQYVNSLACGYAFEDAYDFMTSERDGILTFLWYIERYLHLARTEYPQDHAFLLGNDCWRDAILTVWGRAWLYLDATRSSQSLGLDDQAIEALVNTPELLAEIDRVRQADGCP